MSFLKEFKAFAMKGSVIDLAVGVVIGGAFGKIVTSMVEDVMMPLVAMVTGKGELFTDKYLLLKAAKEGEIYPSLAEARKAGANVFAYGHFIQSIVDFIIIAFFIFVAIRFMNRLHSKQEEAVAAAPPGPTPTEILLAEIRDELKKR